MSILAVRRCVCRDQNICKCRIFWFFAAFWVSFEWVRASLRHFPKSSKVGVFLFFRRRAANAHLHHSSARNCNRNRSWRCGCMLYTTQCFRTRREHQDQCFCCVHKVALEDPEPRLNRIHPSHYSSHIDTPDEHLEWFWRLSISL